MRTITIKRNSDFRTIPIGFSWTTLLFGPIPSAVKGNWPYAVAMFVAFAADFLFMLRTLNVIVGLPLWFIMMIAFAYFRNGFLLKYFISDGWRVVCEYQVPTLVYNSHDKDEDE